MVGIIFYKKKFKKMNLQIENILGTFLGTKPKVAFFFFTKIMLSAGDMVLDLVAKHLKSSTQLWHLPCQTFIVS